MIKTKQSKFLLVGVVIIILFLLPVFIDNIYWIHVFTVIAINIILTISLLAISRTGEMSLGVAGFMLLGAYSSALLTLNAGISPWIALPIGGLFAAIVAFAVGYPFFRLKGPYFVICTILLAQIFQYVAGFWDTLTGGWSGLRNIPPLDPIPLGILTIRFDTGASYYYFTVILTVIILFILYRMMNSRIGLTWLAIREADNLAESVGINVTFQKVFIFAVGSFFCGIAGGMYAFYVHVLTPATQPGNIFSMATSVYALMYLVVGGMSSFAGPIIGTIIMLLIPEIARPLQQYRPLLNGAIIILVVYFLPNGIVSLGYQLPYWYHRLSKRLSKVRI